MSISGSNLPGDGYASQHRTGSGESVSLKLTPGTYTLIIRDETPYEELLEEKTPLKHLELRMDVQPWKTAEILGRISRDGKQETMPVSLRVAEFVQDESNQWKRKDNYNLAPEKGGVHDLDPSKPVWVVVHGRKDHEGSNKIADLVKALKETDRQVVTLNWTQGASDNGIGVLEGADWIPAVGAWAANHLKAVGFSGEHIHIAGHSWGSFVAYEIGKQFKEGNGFGVQAIVALDSPKDPLPVNRYPSAQVAFSDVSHASWAFKSSIFGSERRAHSADFSFDLITPSEYWERHNPLLSPVQKALIDSAQAYLFEHGYAVSCFANLLRGHGDHSLSILRIQDLESGVLPIPVHVNAAEGEISLGVQQVTDEHGTWWQAIPKQLALQSER